MQLEKVDFEKHLFQLLKGSKISFSLQYLLGDKIMISLSKEGNVKRVKE